MVPDFTVGEHLDRLRLLHNQIQQQGRFLAHSTRTLIEATKP
jgi:hypothetical protein